MRTPSRSPTRIPNRLTSKKTKPCSRREGLATKPEKEGVRRSPSGQSSQQTTRMPPCAGPRGSPRGTAPRGRPAEPAPAAHRQPHRLSPPHQSSKCCSSTDRPRATKPPSTPRLPTPQEQLNPGCQQPHRPPSRSDTSSPQAPPLAHERLLRAPPGSQQRAGNRSFRPLGQQQPGLAATPGVPRDPPHTTCKRPSAPTSFGFVSANISSWTHGWPHILAAAEARKCQVICLQETRLTSGRCRAARSLARAAGWVLYASPAVPTGMRGPAPGGVAVAVRRPRGSAPADPGMAKPDAADGRFVACVVEGGPGTPPWL